MFQRILSVLLCTCLVAGSVPETTYAAALSTETQAEVQTEDILEETAEENAPVEEPEGTSEEGKETAEVPESVGETTVEETVAPAETATEAPETAEEVTTEETEESTTEETVLTEEATEETTEVSEAAEEVTEDATEISEETTEETVVEPLIEQTESESTDIELSLTEAKSSTLQELGEEGAKWFAFTAPEAGYYFFNSSIDTSACVYTYMYEDKADSSWIEAAFPTPSDGTFYEMAADETVYIKVLLWDEIETTISITVTAVPQGTWTLGENGVYKAVCGEYEADIEVETGYRTVNGEITVSISNDTACESYYIVYQYIGKYTNQEASMLISSNGGYKCSIDDGGLPMGQNYEMRVFLEDINGNALAVFAGESNPICFATKYTEEPIFLTVGEPEYNCVDIEYEAMIDDLTGHYAPVAALSEEKSFEFENASSVIRTLGNLKPSTEYLFWVEDKEGNKLLEEKFTTKDLTLKAEYQIAAGVNSVTVTADVSEYDGENNDLYLKLKYIDENGNEQIESTSISLSTVDGTKTGETSYTIENLLAETSYSVTVWLQEEYSYNNGYVHYAEETKEITTETGTMKAADVTLEAAQNTGVPTTMDCTITIPEQTEEVAANLYYRVNGESTWNSAGDSISISGSSASTSITGLMEGMEYEVKLTIPAQGICKLATCRMGTSAYTIEVSDKTYTFGSDLTYQLSPTEALTENQWYVTASYKRSGNNSYSSLVSKSELTSDNDYKLEATIREEYETLMPDTDYIIKWELYKGSETNACYITYQEIHTKDIVIEEESIGVTSASFTVSVPEYRDEAKDDSVWLYAYIKEEGRTYKEESSGQVRFFGTDDCSSGTINFSNLKPGTTYVVSLRDDVTDGIEYKSFSFTTAADERVLTIDEIKTYLKGAKISYTLSGSTTSEKSYVLIYFREKGSSVWQSYCDFTYQDCSDYFEIFSYDGEVLKENTTYEYVIGFGKSAETLKNCLTQSKTGEFTIPSDDRQISVSVTPYFYDAKMKMELTGSTVEDSSSWLTIYLWEKGKDDLKNRFFQEAPTAGTYSMSLFMPTGTLDPGTTYEYVVGIGNSWNIGETGLTNKVSGEFTTRKSEYTLDIEADEENSTYNKEVLNVTAKGSMEEERIYVTISLDNGMSENVVLVQGKDYKGTITFDNLMANTTYKITEAELSVNDGSSDFVMDKLTPDISFTTKTTIAPTAITLSETELTLNAAELSEGIGWKKLTATVTPEGAAEDIIWSSSNEDVAYMWSDGTVCAAGNGTAVITAASCYDETITASCNVTVKDYIVAKTENGITERITSEQIYKGDSIDVGLYERADDDTLTLVEGFTVTPERSSVAEWKDGKLAGTAIGTTNVIFEKDGVKATLVVNVLSKAKGFGIVGLNTANTDYPAIEATDGGYEIAYVDGITYTAKGEISPSAEFDATEFNWTSSDETIAVAADGVIKPKKAGKVTITVTPKGETSPYVQEKVEVKLDVKELPATGETETYALTNLKKNMLLADVEFPDGWEKGWEWKEPQTPLYSLPVNDDAYSFEAVYTGTGKYAVEKTVNVYIGTVTGIDTYEVYENHNQVIQISEAGAKNKDEICLMVSPQYTGTFYPYLWSYIETDGESGISIEKGEESGSFIITASKEGNYTLKSEIQVKTGEKDAAGKEIMQTLASDTYKVKAVKEAQAYSITLVSETEDVKIDEENGRIVLDWSEETAAKLKGKEIALKATVKDRNGNEINTALEWKITDKSVAAVNSAKNDSHSAVVKIQGDGHAVLTVKAKDVAGYTAKMDFEIRDHRPRVDVSKATINLAYDYEDSYYGYTLASVTGGNIEIAEVYGETIESVKLYEEDGKTPAAKIETVCDGGRSGLKFYLVKPVGNELTVGTYKCKLAVKTTAGETEYLYPLEVKVENKAPKVTAKMSEKLNLFYLTKTGKAAISISGTNCGIEELIWEDNSKEENNGFEFNSIVSWNAKKKAYIADISQEKVKVENGKLTDSDVAAGTLKVKLYGVREPIEVKNFKVGYSYKKPALKTVKSSTSVVPKTGNTSNQFQIYDNQLKQTLVKADRSDCYCYNEISCNSETVSFENPYSIIYYTYTGKEKKETITLTLNSPNWREGLEAKHTIKVIEPKAKLYVTTMTYNKAYKSEVYTQIGLQDNNIEANLNDVVIEGADTKAQALVDKDIFEISNNGSNLLPLKVKLNQVKLMNEDVNAGTYAFNLTPYYTNAETGEKTALNTLKLKLKVVDKPVTVKISPKGTLDLAKSTQNGYNENMILMCAKFANIGDGCQVVDAKLNGEYSKYFKLVKPDYNNDEATNSIANYYRLKIADYGKLKANQTYKLSVNYTVRTSSGDEFTVESNVMKVKPKQTAPKVTVYNNNQTMYAASESERYYYISVPSGYSIEGVYGSLDCNKDGESDIIAYAQNELYGTGVNVNIQITDAAAVTASAKGKTYSIPITVKVTGRDGVSKDAATTIKVKVKR